MNKKKLNKHIKNLNTNGITYIQKAFSLNECRDFVKKFERLLIKFEKKYRRLGNNCQVIQNYFCYDRSLISLLYHKQIDTILTKAIDKNYVLINTSLTNRVLRKSKSRKKIHLGDHGTSWHTDSRVIGNKRLDKGFSYIVIMMFNDFDEDNGSTEFVPKSHLIRNKVPKRNGKYISKKILGKAGTIVIIDTGLWHKASNELSTKNRWSIFSYYGPWFMKPYFNYPSMFKKNYRKKLSAKIQTLLHYNSIPPNNELERVNTLKDY